MDKTLADKLGLSLVQRTALETLEENAKNRTTITYGELGRLIDVAPENVGKFLFPLQKKLNEVGYPPLNYLVVNKETGIPGDGANAPHNGKLIDPIKAREEVYQYFAQKR